MDWWNVRSYDNDTVGDALGFPLGASSSRNEVSNRELREGLKRCNYLPSPKKEVCFLGVVTFGLEPVFTESELRTAAKYASFLANNPDDQPADPHQSHRLSEGRVNRIRDELDFVNAHLRYHTIDELYGEKTEIDWGDHITLEW